jgi:hypothetical protein
MSGPCASMTFLFAPYDSRKCHHVYSVTVGSPEKEAARCSTRDVERGLRGDALGKLRKIIYTCYLPGHQLWSSEDSL